LTGAAQEPYTNPGRQIANRPQINNLPYLATSRDKNRGIRFIETTYCITLTERRW
jgi:hypothetical protein